MRLEGTGVEHVAVVNEQHAHIGVPFAQVGKGSVVCNRECVICLGDMRIGVGQGCLG